MASQYITADQLRSLVHYDPETGAFTARYASHGRPVGRFLGTLSRGYWLIGLRGRVYRANRLAWLYMTGEWPQGVVDHRNRIRSDDRWSNLRDVELRINAENCSTTRKKKQGSLTGASWDKQTGRWKAHIKVGGMQKHLGRFDTELQAHEAYLSAKRDSHSGFSHGENQ